MYKGKKVAVIVAAAGSSRRMGYDKLFAVIDEKPVLWHAVSVFIDMEVVDEIIIVAGENIEKVRQLFCNEAKITHIVHGGADRYTSVKKGVECTDAYLVAIHDGARPFVKNALVEKVLEAAYEKGAVTLAVPVKDTIKTAKNGIIETTLERSRLYAVQTPQAFFRELYLEAWHAIADKEGITDDSMLVERYGKPAYLVDGDYENIKITTSEDLGFLEKRRGISTMRIGHGYDVHKFAEDRKLILGGVDIPYAKGLDGHSDADVLLHAISDALLGALALGDIGKFFPDTDPVYEGANSLLLLKNVYEEVKVRGYKIGNIDATIVCQKPKLAGYINAMRKAIAGALQVSVEQISVKATTEEGLGFTGAEEGIAAHCVCIVTEK